MSEVQVRKLSDIESAGEVELGRGEVISNIDLATWLGNYPVYSSSAAGEGEFGRYGKYMFDEELITWSIDGGGRPFYRKKHKFSVTNVSGFLRIKRRDKWNYRYLHALLSKLQAGIQFDYQMKAHPSVIRELYKLRWIPIHEQETIAQILDTLDTQIRQTEALIAKLERIKQGLLTDLLTRGIDQNGQLRPTPDQAPQLYKESPLGRIPREWEIKPAHLVCAAVIDCKNRTPPETTTGHPVIRTPNVRDGRFVHSGLTYTDALSYEIWTQRGKPRPGDVLITREAPVGEACLVPADIANACLGQRMMMYQPDPEQLHNDFMLTALLSPAVQCALLDLAGGSTVGHVRVGDIRNLLIPLPGLEEQARIAESYKELEHKLKSEEGVLAKLASAKNGLMDDLLTGRVRVTPLLDTAEEAHG